MAGQLAARQNSEECRNLGECRKRRRIQEVGSLAMRMSGLSEPLFASVPSESNPSYVPHLTAAVPLRMKAKTKQCCLSHHSLKRSMKLLLRTPHAALVPFYRRLLFSGSTLVAVTIDFPSFEHHCSEENAEETVAAQLPLRRAEALLTLIRY